LSPALGIGKLGIGKTTTREFAQAGRIEHRDQITVAGVHVGRVTGMRLDGRHVEVSLEMADTVPMGQASRAAVKLTTLLGARYVEVMPAGTGKLTDNRIPLTQTEVPYDCSIPAGPTRTSSGVSAMIAESMELNSDQLRAAHDHGRRSLTTSNTCPRCCRRRDQIRDADQHPTLTDCWPTTTQPRRADDPGPATAGVWWAARHHVRMINATT
jgi:ABC-type transporter Mla subunit MlaD